MKTKRTLSVYILGILLLSGCGLISNEEFVEASRNPDWEIAEEETSKEKNAKSERNQSLRTQIDAPSHTAFTTESQDGIYKVTVDAKVVVPDLKHMPVAEVQVGDITEEDLESLTKAFFGDGEVNYLEHMGQTSKAELEKQLAEAEDEMKTVPGEEIEHYTQMITNLKKSIEDAPEEYIPPGDVQYIFEVDQYDNHGFSVEGECNGVQGNLNISRSKREEGARVEISFYTEKNFEVSVIYAYGENYTVRVPSDLSEKIISENSCQYSEEEAIDLGMNILEQMGKQDGYQVNRVYQLVGESKDAVEVKNEKGEIEYIAEYYDEFIGYSIHLSRAVNGVTTGFSSYPEWEHDSSLPEKYSYDYETICYQVTDDGIISFDWYNPMDLTEIKTEHVQLLPYNEIENKFRELIRAGENIKEYEMEYTEIDINEIELCLRRVKNKDHQTAYSLIPAWEFYGENGSDPFLFAINAIDGSTINKLYGY